MSTKTSGNQDNTPYLHGYTGTEQERLRRQAKLTEALIYRDIDFMELNNVLEVGCGVGAQTEILLRRFPNTHITGIDLNQEQLNAAEKSLSQCPWAGNRYSLLQRNAKATGFDNESFDGAFLCWVLEHIPAPQEVLSEIHRVLKPGSPLYITEVMNSSFFLDPYSPSVWQYWVAFNDYQHEVAGDPFIGAKLGNFLQNCGYRQIRTRVKTFHFDNRRPEQRKTMIAFWSELMASAADVLIDAGRVSKELVANMKAEMEQVQDDPNAVFFYNFIQARAVV